jgi:putative phosphonate metabolism protein
MSARYAIYFVPGAETPLYRFGAVAIGYDCFTGAEIPTLEGPPVDADTWRKLTDEPRRYGFHATLKAPFRLAPSCDEAELIAAFAAFAPTVDGFPVVEPVVRLLHRFVAVVPATANAALDRLAASCVMYFDHFRAPLKQTDRDRRRAAHLTARQVENVERWGYPYVFDEFRFHMTLTGALAANEEAIMLGYLRDRFARLCGERPVPIDHLALLRQAAPDARFVMLAHAAIGPPL